MHIVFNNIQQSSPMELSFDGNVLNSAASAPHKLIMAKIIYGLITYLKEQKLDESYGAFENGVTYSHDVLEELKDKSLAYFNSNHSHILRHYKIHPYVRVGKIELVDVDNSDLSVRLKYESRNHIDYAKIVFSNGDDVVFEKEVSFAYEPEIERTQAEDSIKRYILEFISHAVYLYACFGHKAFALLNTVFIPAERETLTKFTKNLIESDGTYGLICDRFIEQINAASKTYSPANSETLFKLIDGELDQKNGAVFYKAEAEVAPLDIKYAPSLVAQLASLGLLFCNDNHVQDEPFFIIFDEPERCLNDEKQSALNLFLKELLERNDKGNMMFLVKDSKKLIE